VRIREQDYLSWAIMCSYLRCRWSNAIDTAAENVPILVLLTGLWIQLQITTGVYRKCTTRWYPLGIIAFSSSKTKINIAEIFSFFIKVIPIGSNIFCIRARILITLLILSVPVLARLIHLSDNLGDNFLDNHFIIEFYF
jgi:hypothetical protein